MNSVCLDIIDFRKGGGLVPVIVQDSKTREVLTLAYTNKDALMRTLETGFAHYYRRSHRKVMKKGVTSGNFQKIIDVFVDCDFDSIIYLVEQEGVACHLGKFSCFHNKLKKALVS